MGLFSTWPSVKRKAAAPSILLSPFLSHPLDRFVTRWNKSKSSIYYHFLLVLPNAAPARMSLLWESGMKPGLSVQLNRAGGGFLLEGESSSLWVENVQRGVFIRCRPASQLGRLRQTAPLLHATVYTVSLSHCLFHEHNLSLLLCYPICLDFQPSFIAHILWPPTSLLPN